MIARQTIGPDGGEISGGGLTLSIPAFALTAETEIEIRTANVNLSGADFTQAGEALALYPDGLILRQPSRLTFTNAPDEPAVLFEQDGLTVAALGTTAYTNELGRVARASAGAPTVSVLMPSVGATPGDAGAPHRDTAHMQMAVADVADLYLSLTIYDTERSPPYVKPLNGTGDGDCGFSVENLSGGSLASNCSEGFHTATIRVTSSTIDFDIVPFLAGKMETPVTVGIVAGGSEIAYMLGFFRFDTGACFNETCSGRGTCEVVDGAGQCNCEFPFAGDGLQCVCVPQCSGRECGPDQCGQNCEPGCGDGFFCDNDAGQCVPNADPTDTDGMDGSSTGEPSDGSSTGEPDPDTGSSSGSGSTTM